MYNREQLKKAITKGEINMDIPDALKDALSESKSQKIEHAEHINFEKQKIDVPTCGCIVHFFDENASGPFPAIVQDNDTYPTLTVFSGNVGSAIPACYVVLSVPHVSVKIPNMPYWSWPNRQ